MKDHVTKLEGIVGDIYGADALSTQMGEEARQGRGQACFGQPIGLRHLTRDGRSNAAVPA